MLASSTLRCAKLMITAPSLLVPSRSGSQMNDGMFRTCHSSLPRGLYFSGRMNMLRANRFCHAFSVVTRIGM